MAEIPGALLTRDQRLDWLRLIRSENVGPATFRNLLNHYGSARAALDVLPDLAKRGGASTQLKIPSLADADRELERLEAFGARLVAIGEADYPGALKSIAAPPPLISVNGGGMEIMQRPAAAIVGSRNASIAGGKMAERLARGLGAAGIVIVSGLARGIDAAAHRASLASGTIAVIAGGIDHVYPEEHAPLMADIIAAGGAVVSEMPFGWEPRAQDFPRRNRIISGISLGVIVVEAAARSGTLHTARFALEQGREVFAVPGSPLDPRAEGTNRLIRQGATLVTTAEDILEGLRPMIGQETPTLFGADEPMAGDEADSGITDAIRRAVQEALSPVPTAIDDICLHTGLATRQVMIVILELELAGRIERHGNQLVSLT